MAVVGPEGVAALGAFATSALAKKSWLDYVLGDVAARRRDTSTWLGEAGEPRSKTESLWDSFEHIGWTMRRDEHIKEWIVAWVQEHPTYKAIDPMGNECNEQTFAIDFISWLIDGPYRRITDNTKGRVLAYGGLALIAGIGIAMAYRASR